jgi:hypothetical protein
MKTENLGFLAGMKGLTLEAMRGVASTGRAVGKFSLCFDGERWVLVFRPPGGTRPGWANHGFYLMSETSRKPRRFARADTALRTVAQLRVMRGIWVNFENSGWGFRNPDMNSLPEDQK